MSPDWMNASGANTVVGEDTSEGETTTPAIECCIDNVGFDDRRTIEASNESVDIRYCLQRCGRCYREPFVVVDGDVVTGADYSTILETIESEGSDDA